MNKNKISRIGKQIKFKAERIIVGNPVKGTIISEDNEWIEVKLEHDIEGMVNVWEAGEIKSFRKILIKEIE